MAGTLVIDTLTASSGVLATQNGMTGIAKAWVSFNGTNGTIYRAFNVSSITRNSTGNYTTNFTTAMPNTTYTPIASGYGGNNGSLYGAGDVRTTTSCQFSCVSSGGTVVDVTIFSVAVFA